MVTVSHSLMNTYSIPGQALRQRSGKARCDAAETQCEHPKSRPPRGTTPRRPCGAPDAAPAARAQGRALPRPGPGAPSARSRPRRGKEFPADAARRRFLSPWPHRPTLRGPDAAPRGPPRRPRQRPRQRPPAPCSLGSCSSGRRAASTAGPRGACGCSCGRRCGAGRAATGGGPRSDCCTPGRGPTQVTPGRPARPRRPPLRCALSPDAGAGRRLAANRLRRGRSLAFRASSSSPRGLHRGFR